jgi:ketosteroid isomerase-like protein
MRLRILFTALTLTVHSIASAQVKEEIERLSKSMTDAFARGDMLAIAAHYGDSARIASTTGTAATGRTEVNKYWQTFPAEGRTWKLEVLDVGGSRDVAYQLGRSTVTSAQRSQTVNYIGIWRRQPDGQLKLVFDYFARAIQPPEGDQSVAVRELAHLDSVWARNYATNDTATALQLMHDNFYMTSTNAAIKNRDGELRDIRLDPRLRMKYFTTQQMQTRVYGSAAVVTGIAEWSFDMGGNTRTARRRYTAVYLKGGPLGWQLLSLHMALAE